MSGSQGKSFLLLFKLKLSSKTLESLFGRIYFSVGVYVGPPLGVAPAPK